MAMHTGSFSNIVTLRGIQEVVQNKWDARPAIGRKLFNVKDSNQYREHSLTVGGFGQFDVKGQGEALNYDSLNEGFLTTFTHVTYAKGARSTHEMMADELYGILDKIGVYLANSAIATEETVLANHFNNATDTGYTGGDGQVLCSAAHLLENGQTYRNTTVNSSGTRVSADLSQSSLEQALIDFRSQFKDGGGLRLRIVPKVLLHGTDNIFEAARLLDSKQDPETDRNATNPISGLGLEGVCWDYLTDTDSWGLLAAKDEQTLVLFDREAFNTDSIYDFDTKDGKVSAMMRFSSGWEDARGIYWVIGA